MAEHHCPHKKITAELPPDILYHNILPRLPAESLLRFRYVSKQWHSILSSPEFITSHLHYATTDHHQKLLVSSSTIPCNFHTIDCESPENGLSPRRPFPFKVPPENTKILTSFNGLVCVGVTNRIHDDNYSDMILWNPLSGDYKRLSESNSRKECYEVSGRASALYYTHSDDDYKLLRVSNSHRAYIYSLKSDSWRKIHSGNDLEDMGYLVSESWGESIVQNDKVFFLRKGKRRTMDQLSYSIVGFDMEREKFTVVETPCFGVRRRRCLNLKLLDKDGRIHLSLIYRNCMDLGAKLWRMDEDGDGDWIEVESYPNLPSLYCFQEPVHLMKNGNWVTYCLHSGCHVYKLDLAKGLNEISYSNLDESIDISPTVKYIESLVSPNYN